MILAKEGHVPVAAKGANAKMEKSDDPDIADVEKDEAVVTKEIR